MSPEGGRGQEEDRRQYSWSYGCLLDRPSGSALVEAAEAGAAAGGDVSAPLEVELLVELRAISFHESTSSRAKVDIRRSGSFFKPATMRPERRSTMSAPRTMSEMIQQSRCVQLNTTKKHTSFCRLQNVDCHRFDQPRGLHLLKAVKNSVVVALFQAMLDCFDEIRHIRR